MSLLLKLLSKKLLNEAQDIPEEAFLQQIRHKLLMKFLLAPLAGEAVELTSVNACLWSEGGQPDVQYSRGSDGLSVWRSAGGDA